MAQSGELQRFEFVQGIAEWSDIEPSIVDGLCTNFISGNLCVVPNASVAAFVCARQPSCAGFILWDPIFKPNDPSCILFADPLRLRTSSRSGASFHQNGYVKIGKRYTIDGITRIAGSIVPPTASPFASNSVNSRSSAQATSTAANSTDNAWQFTTESGGGGGGGATVLSFVPLVGLVVMGAVVAGLAVFFGRRQQKGGDGKAEEPDHELSPRQAPPFHSTRFPSLERFRNSFRGQHHVLTFSVTPSSPRNPVSFWDDASRYQKLGSSHSARDTPSPSTSQGSSERHHGKSYLGEPVPARELQRARELHGESNQRRYPPGGASVAALPIVVRTPARFQQRSASPPLPPPPSAVSSSRYDNQRRTRNERPGSPMPPRPGPSLASLPSPMLSPRPLASRREMGGSATETRSKFERTATRAREASLATLNVPQHDGYVRAAAQRRGRSVSPIPTLARDGKGDAYARRRSSLGSGGDRGRVVRFAKDGGRAEWEMGRKMDGEMEHRMERDWRFEETRLAIGEDRYQDGGHGMRQIAGEPPDMRAVFTWTPKMVGDWLAWMGHTPFISQKMLEQNINGTRFLLLTESKLLSMSIRRPEVIRAILDSVDQLREENADAPTPTTQVPRSTTGSSETLSAFGSDASTAYADCMPTETPPPYALEFSEASAEQRQWHRDVSVDRGRTGKSLELEKSPQRPPFTVVSASVGSDAEGGGRGAGVPAKVGMGQAEVVAEIDMSRKAQTRKEFRDEKGMLVV
ncbi:hypothetical protein HDU96_008512 [Phlyctochytrium bullatum]|nr:hypothetical protein HDU96_008512 [Phlyctochytrium bullatum]